MDDLISREAALEAIDRERGFLIENKMYGAEHVVVHHARRIIEDLPSVEAIPIEWVRSQLKNNPNDIESAYGDICLNELIDKWQMEQGAKE